MTEEADEAKETAVLTPARKPPRTERPRWLLVTAGALGVALLTGGLFGAQAVFGRSGGEGAGAASEPMVAEPDASGERGAFEDWRGPYGVSLEAVGELPESPGNASVYGFPEELGEEEVAALAAVLGVEGGPRLSDGFWHVAGPDADAPYLTVSTGAGEWSYHTGSLSDEYTYIVPGDPDDPDASVSSGEVPQVEPAEPVAPPPSVAEALEVAGPLLDLLGLTDAPVEERERHDGNRTLVFPRVVDGLWAHGMETEITVSPQGAIVGSSGAIGEPVVEGEGAMLSAGETLDERNADMGRYETFEAWPEPGECVPPPHRDGAEPMPHIDGDPATEDQVAPAGPECEIAVEPVRAEVTGAEQALMLWQESDFTARTLVPAWSFTVGSEDGIDSIFSYPAVEYDFGPAYGGGADEWTAEPGEPSQGAAEPADPGEGGTTGGSDGGSEPGYTGTSVDAYDAMDTTLELTYWTGVCAEYQLVAEESADEVRVLVEEVPGDAYEACILVAEEQTGELSLHSPIGDRTLVDEWGQEIPVS